MLITKKAIAPPGQNPARTPHRRSPTNRWVKKPGSHHLRRLTMKTRTSLLALAATAALALSALTPTNASASGRFGGPHFGGLHGYHHGFYGGYPRGFYGYPPPECGRFYWWPGRRSPRVRWDPRPTVYPAPAALPAPPCGAPGRSGPRGAADRQLPHQELPAERQRDVRRYVHAGAGGRADQRAARAARPSVDPRGRK